MHSTGGGKAKRRGGGEERSNLGVSASGTGRRERDREGQRRTTCLSPSLFLHGTGIKHTHHTTDTQTGEELTTAGRPRRKFTRHVNRHGTAPPVQREEDMDMREDIRIAIV